MGNGRKEKHQKISIVSDWTGRYAFLHPDAPCSVKWKGFVFPSVSHALTFAAINPRYSYRKNAFEILAEKIARTKTKNLVNFDSYPKVSDWHEYRFKDTLWKLNLQKFRSGRQRRSLLDMRNKTFVFTQSYGGRPPDSFMCGRLNDKGEIVGNNMMGECLSSLRRHLSSKLIVLVCGGREYSNSQMVFRVLDFLDSVYRIETVVHGNAKGADTFGKNWAVLNKRTHKAFYAKWKDLTVKPCIIRHNSQGSYNSLAGFNRNNEMADYLASFNTDPKKTRFQVVTLGFTGENGTHHMLKMSLKRNIPTFYQQENKMKLIEKTDQDGNYIFNDFIPNSYSTLTGEAWF